MSWCLGSALPVLSWQVPAKLSASWSSAWASVPVADPWPFWGGPMVSIAAIEAGVLVSLGLLME